ncbi:MAG: type II toxin-antitoxin system VapC family toxin [Neorhizobium sp.]|jgi:PIN domain nuclease of toxin-antitoxin system|nr:type II toxin-antitoxin system VapC family toxin [Neorhizobium sp.]
MRLLLDTHFVLAGVNQEMSTRYPDFDRLLDSGVAESFVSVVSLWEIAIKARLGKLVPRLPVEQIPDYLHTAHFQIITITVPHVIAVAKPEPPTRDPFDRLLLAQCQFETMQLVTVDRALAGHPLAFRP